MSYTEIYKFGKDGNAECFSEIKNAWRGIKHLLMVERGNLMN